MKEKQESLVRLHLTMLGGYVSLFIVFIIASCIIITKSGALEENSLKYKENIERRTLSEQAFFQLLDLTQMDGQAAILDDERLASYERKERDVLCMLDSMIQTIPDTAQVRRVREIKDLVREKKAYLIAVHDDLKQLRDVNGLMKRRMPEIIRQANRANQQLTDEVSENLKENRRKTTGLGGAFRSKKKANEETEASNQQALSRARRQTDKILSSYRTLSNPKNAVPPNYSSI